MSCTVLSTLDLSPADAAIGEVLDGKFFFATEEPIKEGTMPTVAIVAANDNYPAGYHVGNVGGLPAIDADLVEENIPETITMFGIAGTYISYVLGNDTIVLSAAEIGWNFVSWGETKRLLVGSHVRNENMRTYFELMSVDLTQVFGRVYKNGGAVGIERSTVLGAWQTYTEDLNFDGGDLCSIYQKSAVGFDAGRTRLFIIKGTIVPLATIYGFRDETDAIP